VQVDGIPGEMYDITGVINQSNFTGQAVVVIVNENQFLFGLGIKMNSSDENPWEGSASQVFDQMVQSIKFSEPSAQGDSCPVSTDATYGYTIQNPIKVGGDFLSGPARERAYLDSLRGPQGEAVTYERAGTEQTDSSILDTYVLTIAGQAGTKTIYLDEYTYEDLLIPAGFRCVSPIPLQAP
jgi:hypothetical protein